MLQIVRIRGNSIAPYLNEGDFAILLKSRWIRKPLHRDDFIVFDEKQYGILIKQIDTISTDGDLIHVRGTDDFSIDSRFFGAIHRKQVKGKVLFRIRA
jgi:signal peptidase I